MSLEINLARSSVPNKAPQPSDLSFGSIGLNFASENPFFTVKDADGVIRRMDRFEVSASAPLSPTEGQAWLDTSGAAPVLKVFEGGSWVSASGITPPSAATTGTLGLVRLADATAVTAGTPGRVVDAAQLLAVSSQIAQSDWTAPPGDPAEILNKPTIPPAYTLPTATPTVLGGVLTANSTSISAGTAGRVVDAAQLKAVSDVANAALPAAGGTIANDLTVTGDLFADLTGNVSGNVTGNVVGDVAGNAATADALSTAREINGVEFDGSADITIEAIGPNPEALTAGTFLNGSAYDGSAPVTWNVSATSAATPSTLVSRDGSGNIAVNQITGNLVGNADTATEADRLSTPRSINGVSFDGSADISIPLTNATLSNSLTPGAYIDGAAFDGSSAETWDIVAAEAATPETLAARDATGGLTAAVFNGSLNGTANVALSANTLATPRTINGVAFNGSANITIPSSPGGQAELTVGPFMTGGPYTGAAPVRFDLVTTIGPTPDSLPARDGDGKLRAVAFVGDLEGEADSAVTSGSAATLSTSRNLWGRPFNGSADISGNLTGVGTITPTGGSALTLPTAGGTLARTADLVPSGLNAVGAYVLVSRPSGTAAAQGTTVAGSELVPASQRLEERDTGTPGSLSGTWRIMGGPIVNNNSVTLAVKISD